MAHGLHHSLILVTFRRRIIATSWEYPVGLRSYPDTEPIPSPRSVLTSDDNELDESLQVNGYLQLLLKGRNKGDGS